MKIHGPVDKPSSKEVFVELANHMATGPYTYTNVTRGDDIRIVAALCEEDSK